jgi:Kef-type K+ transport system membrane component KefB
MAFITGRIRSGQPTLVEALGLVFVCGGLALWLNVSLILAAIVMGVVVTNLARHHDYPFHAIEDIDWPFLILFFILAGASLKLSALPKIGIIGVIYIAARIIGRIIGSQLGGIFSRAEKSMRRLMGLAMLPQAGVAMGMALLAVLRFPDFADTILPLVIGATVFFELLGPVFTRFALKRVGEIPPIMDSGQ